MGSGRWSVFGSVACGEQHENINVDIYVEGELKRLFALAGIKNELEELFGCQVDIIHLRDRTDTFLKKEYRRMAFMFDKEET